MNFLKQGVLLFGLSLLLWNCERGEIIQEQNILQYKSLIESREIVSLNDLNPSIKNAIINSENNFFSKSQKDISYSINDIIKIVDTLQNTKFSIRFKLNNQPENIIYNLITGTRNDNSTHCTLCDKIYNRES